MHSDDVQYGIVRAGEGRTVAACEAVRLPTLECSRNTYDGEFQFGERNLIVPGREVPVFLQCNC